MNKIKYFLVTYFKPQFKYLAGAFILMLVASIVSLAPPRLIGNSIEAIEQHNFNTLLVYTLLAVAITIFGAFVNFAINRLFIHVQNEVILNLRKDIFKSAINMSYSDSSKIDPGDINTRIMVDVRNIAALFSGVTVSVVVNLIKVIIVLVYLIIMNSKLTLISFVQLVPVLVFFNIFMTKFYDKTQAIQKKLDGVYSLIHHYINGLKTIKLLAIEKKASADANQSLQEARDKDEDFSILGSTMEFVNNIFNVFNIVLVWIFGGIEVINGHMSIGDLVTFNMYIAMLYGPVSQMIGLSGSISSAAASIDRICEIDLEKRTSEEQDSDVPDCNISGGITIEDVAFSYDASHKIFENLSISIPPNSLVGIVGASGIGKSTLGQLIVRLIEPVSGSIYIDNTNARDFSEQRLRKLVCFIESNTHMFGRSLQDVLMLPQDGSRNTEAAHILGRIGLNEYAEELECGREIDVGVNGSKVSAGQMHRLSIARALLKKPKVLIIDEALSSLDIVQELRVIELLKDYVKEMSIILITHSLNSVDMFDKVFLLKKSCNTDTIIPVTFIKPEREDIIKYFIHDME